MKIGIISDSLNMVYGGIANYVYNLILELSRLEKNIFLINYNKNNVINGNYKEIIIPNYLEKYSKTIIWYMTLRLNGSKLKKLDIIHNPTQCATYFKFKQKYILTVHDITPFLTSNKHPIYRVGMNLLLFPRTLKNADIIIADSKNTKKDLINYFNIEPEKIKVIYLAANKNFKQLSKDVVEKIKEKYKLHYSFILYVGKLEPRKNISALIEGFYKLKNEGLPHKLVIAGKKAWMYKEIFDSVNKFNLNNDVIFTGYVPDNDLPGLYNAAEVFVYPSFYEGFGLPPLEAMACGCPVITSNTSSLPEVVGDAGIMIDPNDIDGLIKAIYRVITDKDLRVSMVKKGLERAKMFSWKKTAEETLKVYKECYSKH